MRSKKILIITYYWPPSGGVGVQRWMNFALELKSRGWEPVILTPENPQFDVKDQDLFERVKSLKTYRIPIWEPFQLFHRITGNKERKNIQHGLALDKEKKSFLTNFFIWLRGNVFVPDSRIFWVRPAAKYAIELIEKEDIAVLVTTGPPHSMHLVGKKIKKKLSVKWLADFRDPWREWDVLDQLRTSSIVKKVHSRLERSVIESADEVITVSKRLADSLGAKVLNNGVGLEKAGAGAFAPDKSKFTIGYFGMLNELRNPSELWVALEELCQEIPDFYRQLSIKLAGVVSANTKHEIGQLRHLREKVEFMGYLPHNEVQNQYSTCNILLLLQNRTSNSKWILPVKLFEYLKARRYILCLGPKESDLGDLIEGKDVGAIVSSFAVQELKSIVQEVFEKRIIPSKSDGDELIQRFSHQTLTTTLEGYLNDLINK